MKRYAAHYLFLPGTGFLKQFVVEMVNEQLTRVFPLEEEVENTEWLPGVIALLTEEEIAYLNENPFFETAGEAPISFGELFTKHQEILLKQPQEVEDKLPRRLPYLLYPFDFIAMRPVAETRHKLLR